MSIKTDESGRSVLTYEVSGIIRRIPIERRGTSKRGTDWVLGGVLLEVKDEGSDGSAQLYLDTWSDEMIELINTMGIGAKVRACFHIECREFYDKFRTSLILDGLKADSAAADYIYQKSINKTNKEG